jgi:putative transposase
MVSIIRWGCDIHLWLSHPLFILVTMARMTSVPFTIVADDDLNAVLWRHAGAARFAYNQCRNFVVDALAERRQVAETARCEGASAREAHALAGAVEVPWSGFDLINAFNGWKRSAAAGVAPDGTLGLTWRPEVSAQVFEEAAVDLGRGLDAWSTSKRGKRKGRRVRFPSPKRKRRCRESFGCATSSLSRVLAASESASTSPDPSPCRSSASSE